jgi:hypothetical protein
MRRIPGNPLKLGSVPGMVAPLEMTPEMRSTHLYICGSTGTGKSKMLESLIWQDIKNWHKSKCGALIIDPHGSLYDSLINRIAWNAPYLSDVPIVPIDLRQKDWTIGYNVMRPRTVADPSVVISNFVQAMSYVWGADGTQGTPLFARLAKEVLWPVYEKNMTLHEVQHLINRTNKRLRTELTAGLSKGSAAQGWAFSNQLSPRDFDAQFSSTVNRFYNFLDAEKLRLMFGTNGASLDLGKALSEGQIIIANLSTEGARVSEEDAALFATLLLSDLWTAAKERGKGTEAGDVKPFYVYIDEFQNFVTPTIAKNLDQARGFGLHLTLANQFPRQILHAGANGAQVYDSIMANARSKIVFSLEGEENLKPLAQHLFMGVMNPNEIKHQLFSRKVMDYVEEARTVHSESNNWSDATGAFTGQTDTEGETRVVYDDGGERDSHSLNKAGANSRGTSRISANGGGRGKSVVPFQRAVFGRELSGVQFRPLDEQLYRAMASLFDQKQRHGVTRLVGMPRPVQIVTPIIQKQPTTKRMKESFLTSRYKKLPFALRSADALKQIEARDAKLAGGYAPEAQDEAIPTRRRIQ